MSLEGKVIKEGDLAIIIGKPIKIKRRKDTEVYLVSSESPNAPSEKYVLKCQRRNLKGCHVNNTLDEIARYKRLNDPGHPGIVKFFRDIDLKHQDYEDHALLLEYVKGTNLHKYLVGLSDRDKALEGKRTSQDVYLTPDHTYFVLNLAKSLASALSYAHDRCVFHKDLKATDVMLSEDGEIKLIDFGLSNNVVTDNKDSYVLGLGNCLAPETVLYGIESNEKQDIYSFGCLLYHALMGKIIFWDELENHREDSFYEKLMGYKKAEHPTVSEDRGNKVLRRIVKRCLEVDPNDRYSVFGEIIDELDSKPFYMRIYSLVSGKSSCFLS